MTSPSAVVGAFGVPHDPLVFAAPDSAPQDVRERVLAAFVAVRERVAALAPTIAIIVGADHYINFGPGCLPRYLLGIGDVAGPIERFRGIEQGAFLTRPRFAQHIMQHGFAEGFDWSVAKVLNVDHSIGLPARLCLDPRVAVVPVYLASGVEPLVSMKRAHELGASIRRAIASYAGSERVVVIASGGMSHWVGMPEQGRVNPEFDERVLGMLARGDTAGLLALDDAQILEEGGNGALEIRNFVCAMGIADAAPGELIHYEPVPAWITGLGFVELGVSSGASA